MAFEPGHYSNFIEPVDNIGFVNSDNKITFMALHSPPFVLTERRDYKNFVIIGGPLFGILKETAMKLNYRYDQF